MERFVDSFDKRNWDVRHCIRRDKPNDAVDRICFCHGAYECQSCYTAILSNPG
jgi:hypothetical protein